MNDEPTEVDYYKLREKLIEIRREHIRETPNAVNLEESIMLDSIDAVRRFLTENTSISNLRTRAEGKHPDIADMLDYRGGWMFHYQSGQCINILLQARTPWSHLEKRDKQVYILNCVWREDIEIIDPELERSFIDGGYDGRADVEGFLGLARALVELDLHPELATRTELPERRQPDHDS